MPCSGHFMPRTETLSTVQDAGWTQGPVGMGTENLSSTGFQTPDCTAQSMSLYQLNINSCIIYLIVQDICAFQH